MSMSSAIAPSTNLSTIYGDLWEVFSLCLCVVSCTRVYYSYLLGFVCLKVKVVAGAAAVSVVALASTANSQAALMPSLLLHPFLPPMLRAHR